MQRSTNTTGGTRVVKHRSFGVFWLSIGWNGVFNAIEYTTTASDAIKFRYCKVKFCLGHRLTFLCSTVLIFGMVVDYKPHM